MKAFFPLLFIDIPVIPYLEEVQEEDLMMQVAAPPRYQRSTSVMIWFYVGRERFYSPSG